MLREMWNFHNDIALRLEIIARHYYHDQTDYRNKIYGADQIEHGTFGEVMIILLREKSSLCCGNEEIAQFIKECGPYVGLNGHDIENETAQNLFDRFKAIYDNL